MNRGREEGTPRGEGVWDRVHGQDPAVWPLGRDPRERGHDSSRPLCSSDSGSGFPGTRLRFRAFSQRVCEVLSARAPQQLGGGGAYNPDAPVSRERGLSPVSTRAEPGPTGRLSARNPNTSQGPLASNKPRWLQTQARAPKEHSPAHIMINPWRGALEVTQTMRKFPELSQVQRAWGGAPAGAPTPGTTLPAPSRACPLQGPNPAPPPRELGSGTTTPATWAPAKSTGRTPTGASPQEAASPTLEIGEPFREDGG